MFLKYLPDIVKRGMLYVANPPLYGLQVGKDKYKFFSDNIEYVDYVRNIFCKDNTIANDKKKTYTKNEIVKILYSNMDYVKLITHVATLFAIDIEFLEFLLYNRDLGFAKFKGVVEKAYPYTKVTKENGTIMIHGLVGSLYQTVFFNDRLLFECKPVIDLIERSSKYYYINGKRSTLYQLMKAFNECEPSGITRYKGLGEMPQNLLGISTILPGYGRILKQYTTDDIKRELKYINSLQSDKSVFIQGIKIRREDIV